MDFPTSVDAIWQRVEQIDPVAYGRTRNFIDGKVTYLSPYISRGVLSTRQVMEHLLSTDISPQRMEKLLQELAWRDYWQQVWIHKGEAIDADLKQAQTPVKHRELATAILQASTGIEVLDQSIEQLEQTGYMHNHVRMYVAAVACNVGQAHWRVPAQWLYYHLLDGDWASNTLSWQWVAGSNSRKKYWANQDNINKYCHTQQRDTFLDMSYETLASQPVPEVLQDTALPVLHTSLPSSPQPLQIDPKLPTLIYNYYNLDPKWHQDESANRVLLLEPSFFERYPVSQKCLDFVQALAQSIPYIQLAVMSFADLQSLAKDSTMIYKEHPTNTHYQGTVEARDWMFEVQGDFPSFFAFWKRGRKELTW